LLFFRRGTEIELIAVKPDVCRHTGSWHQSLHGGHAAALVSDPLMGPDVSKPRRVEQRALDFPGKVVVARVTNDPTRQNVLDISQRFGNNVLDAAACR
jgi:hypothetical protein